MVRIRYLAFVVAGLLVTVSLAMAQAEEEKRLDEGHQYKHQLINISGYVQPRWELWPGFDNTFRIRRAYLGAKGDVTDWLAYRILLTLPDMSISLYDAYIDVNPTRYLGLRVGQFQTPIGFEKLHSSSVILFPERTYASGDRDYFPLMDRDIGVMLIGGIKFVKAQVGVFNGKGRNNWELDEPKDLAARLTFQPLEFLHLGGAYQMGERTIIDTLSGLLDLSGLLEWNFDRWGAEFALTPWDLWLAAELMGGKDDEASLMTYYIEAAWMFKFNLKCYYGLQPAIRYEFNDTDADEEGWERSRVTGGFNFHLLPNHKAKLAICYRRGWIGGEYDSSSDLFIAQLQLKFP